MACRKAQAFALGWLLTGCSGATGIVDVPAFDGGSDAVGVVDASGDGVVVSDAIAAPDAVLVDDAPIDGDAGPPRDPLRVLFVGNSYTAVNDLPAVVRELGAATPEAAVQVETIAPGGARLSDHWSSGDVRARIASGEFGAVVLQGQSLEPLSTIDDFDYHAYLFAGALAAAGTRGVWFATWARRDAHAPYGSPAQMTRALETRYELAAKHNGDAVARVGAAWQLALAELPGVALHADDGSHPSAAGTLLSSCVILQALTGQTPRMPDPPPLGIERDTANALCGIAPRVRCDTGEGFCGGACVDVQFNPSHCGACGVACDEADPCRSGVCGCNPGLTGCSRSCVDLLTDPLNCGGCGKTCAGGTVCERGSCVCKRAGRRNVTPQELAALRPACDSRDDFGSLECSEAAHQACAALDCFSSGFGPPSGHAPSVDSLMCVSGDVRATTYATLRTFVPECDGVAERTGQRCSTAVSRFCASTGATSGFGPVATSGDRVTVTCISNATVVRTTFDELRAHASRCVAHPVTCGVASWSFCASRGHAGGFGPVEVSGNDVDVVCVDP
jgi:hypothetical protein